MPTSPRTQVINAIMTKPRCPFHPKATVLSLRRISSNRLEWVCMDCGERLGDAGPVDYSGDKLVLWK